MMQLSVGNEYFSAMDEYKRGMQAGLAGYLLCGKAISILKGGLWRQEGGHCKSFAAFAKNVLHISPAQSHRMSQVWRELGAILSRPEMNQDISKVVLLLPLIKDAPEEKKEEMLLMSRDLSIEDLKNNILEMQGKGEMATDVCLHEVLIPATRCDKCGKWFINQ